MTSFARPGQAQSQQSPYATATPYGQQQPPRPPAFQAVTQNFDGTTSQMPNYQQRDAFISQINSQLGKAQQQSWQKPGAGAPQLDFQKMWGQAGQMVKDGWQNPFARPAPAMGQSPSAPRGAPSNPASGYRPPTPQNIREDQRQRQQANQEATAQVAAFRQSPEFAAQQLATAEREQQNRAVTEANRQRYRDNLDSQFMRPEGMSDEAFYYLAANSASGDRVWQAPSKGVYQELVGNQRFANMTPGPERDLRERQAYSSFIRHAAPGGARHATDRARAASQAESLGDAKRFVDWRPFEGILQRRA